MAAVLLAEMNTFPGDALPSSAFRLADVNAFSMSTMNMTLGARSSFDLTTKISTTSLAESRAAALAMGTGNVSVGNNGQSTVYSGSFSMGG